MDLVLVKDFRTSRFLLYVYHPESQTPGGRAQDHLGEEFDSAEMAIQAGRDHGDGVHAVQGSHHPLPAYELLVDGGLYPIHYVTVPVRF